MNAPYLLLRKFTDIPMVKLDPRLDGRTYERHTIHYSENPFETTPERLTPDLVQVKRHLCALLLVELPIVMLNDYRPGYHLDFHEDGYDHFAILSLGGAASFGVRGKFDGEELWATLHHGDVVVMNPSADRTHEHSVQNGDERRQSIVFRGDRSWYGS